MFDLFRSRDKAVRVLLGGLLGLVALSMLVYLIPGAGLPAGDRNDQVIAEIGKDVVTIHDVDLDLQSKLKSRQLPPDVVGLVVPQEVEQMIADRALAYQAHRMGFEVSDADLANTLRSFTQLSSLSPEQYRDFLAQQGLSVPEFENNVRKQSYLTALQGLALEGIVVTPADVEKEYKRLNEKLKLDYLAFAPDKFKADVKPSPEDMKGYFNTHRGYFSVPETRSFLLVIVDPVKVSEGMQVSDAQLHGFYDAHKEQFRTPERVKVRHILFKTTEKPQDQVAKIRAQAEDILKQVKNGGDFAKLAEKYSEDPGSGKQGGDLGWVVRGQTVKNFEDSAFSLKPKEISGLVTTEYGFHILQVMDKQDAKLQPFEDVKVAIASDIKKQSVNDKVQSLADDARAQIAKAPQNAQQIAAKLGLTAVNVEKHAPGATIPELGVDRQLDGVAQSLKKGEVSQVQQTGEKLAIVELTDVTAAHPAELADVEGQVRERFVVDKATQAIGEKSKQAAELLKKNGGDLQAVAKSLGLEVKSTDEFTRNGAAQGIGSAQYLADAFNAPVGGIVGPVNVGTQTVVAKVVSKIQPDMSKLATERESMVQQLKSKRAEERALLFQDSVVNKLIQEGKIKIHRDVINRLIAKYRSS
jgi:peptidyl-prolyl cis-trans isomerase D